jgi:hypothetical protein
MESLISFLVFALGQLAEHQDVIQYALGVGTALTAAFTVLRFLGAQSQRQYNVVRAPARSLPPPAARPVPVRPAPGTSSTSIDVAVADLKDLVREENRKSLVYGFAQNLFFFVLGTVTSIVLQGLT